jgi:hypothetical protein
MELQFCLLFYTGVKPGLSHDGENRSWWLFKRRELRKICGSKISNRKMQKTAQ